MKITPEIEVVAEAIYEVDPVLQLVKDENGLVVAKVIASFASAPAYIKGNKIKEAIAAIRALREPSKVQIELGNSEYYNGTGNMHYIYTAMIDAALGENK